MYIPVLVRLQLYDANSHGVSFPYPGQWQYWYCLLLVVRSVMCRVRSTCITPNLKNIVLVSCTHNLFDWRIGTR